MPSFPGTTLSVQVMKTGERPGNESHVLSIQTCLVSLHNMCMGGSCNPLPYSFTCSPSPPPSPPLSPPSQLVPLPLSSFLLFCLPPPSPSFPLPLSPFSHQVPMILDPESEGSKVLEYVGGLLSQMDGLQEKAFTYKSYQKSFKVCK